MVLISKVCFKNQMGITYEKFLHKNRSLQCDVTELTVMLCSVFHHHYYE